MSEKNPDLVALHRTLGDLVDTMVHKQEEATKPDVIKALDHEIRETLFRVTNVQRLLFKQQVAGLEEPLARIDEAKAEVEEAIEDIEDLNRFIQSVTALLGLVDKVVDFLKPL